MADEESQDEPSMEEILASIRRIISEDGEEGDGGVVASSDEAAKGAAVLADDILELTAEVDDLGAVLVEERPVSEANAGPDPEPLVVAEVPASANFEEPLVSDPVIGDAAGTFQQLGQIVTPPNIEQNAQRVTPGGRTIEDHVLEMLRPMLKEWLDQNLPPLVQRLVQREVDRIVHRFDPL